LTAVWRTGDRTLSSGTITDGKTVLQPSIMNQLLRDFQGPWPGSGMATTSHRPSFRKLVFKSCEVEVPIALVMVIAARGISDYVDSALTGVVVCNGRFSYTPG